MKRKILGGLYALGALLGLSYFIFGTLGSQSTSAVPPTGLELVALIPLLGIVLMLVGAWVAFKPHPKGFSKTSRFWLYAPLYFLLLALVLYPLFGVFLGVFLRAL